MKRVLIFVLGAAAGSLVTWKLVENKYKKIADEEIASVQEYYHNKLNALDCENNLLKVEAYDRPVEHPEVNVVEEIEYTAEEKADYEETVASLAYSEEGITIECNDAIEYVKPYVIAPEEFGETGNDTKTLTYYSDFVLTDEDGDMCVDPESIIGDALEHFGDYEDDSVHVRNDNIECDFEILKSERTFSEIYKEDN